MHGVCGPRQWQVAWQLEGFDVVWSTHMHVRGNLPPAALISHLYFHFMPVDAPSPRGQAKGSSFSCRPIVV